MQQPVSFGVLARSRAAAGGAGSASTYTRGTDMAQGGVITLLEVR
jgi:hypothetical protein